MKKHFLIKASILSLLLLIANMSVFAESGIYVGGHFRRDRLVTVPTLKASGFTYVILFNIQVEPTGDLTMDNETLCSNGVYTFAKTQPNYIADVAALKTGLTSIKRVESCIGGWGSTSYDNIKTLINAQGTGPTSILYKNFQALKKAIPSIEAINNDDEQAYDVTTSSSFSIMLYDLGFKTTLAPYMKKSFWQNLATTVNTARPGAIDRIDLQCYDGGVNNNPTDWNINNILLHSGLVNYEKTSAQVTTSMTNWKNTSTTKGGFIWIYNDNNYGLKSYAAAINTVFGGGDVIHYDIMKPHVTVYTEANYTGTAVNFEKGSYSKVGIEAQNLPDKSISSIRVTPGFKVVLYKGDKFTGVSDTITEDTPDLTALNLNDALSSWTVLVNSDIQFSSKSFCLKNRKSGLFMGISDESKTSGAAVQQQKFSKNMNQIWRFGNLGEGLFRLTNLNSSKVLQVRASSTLDNALLEQSDASSNDNQKFIIYPNGQSGYHKLIALHSTKFVEVTPDQANIENTSLVQGGLVTDTVTDWKIIPIYSVMEPHAVLYADDSFGGQGINFEVGEYSTAAMAMFGLSNNVLSSVQVAPGYKIVLYDETDLTGSSVELTGDNPMLSAKGFDNLTSSFAVMPIDGNAIKDSHSSDLLHIYPNPATDILYIDGIGSNIEKAEITNLMGETVLFQKENSGKINVSSLTPGLYILRVYVESKTTPYLVKFNKK